MRIRTALAVAALLPASLAFAVAGSDDATLDDSCRDGGTVTAADGEEVPVSFCVEDLYGQCDNAVDSDGAGKLILPTEAVNLTDAAPTVSFTEGAGCGTVDEPLFTAAGTGASQYQFSASGYAPAGDTDSITFELHFLGPNTGYAGEPLFIDLEAEVDGVSLFGTKESPDATGQNPTRSPAATRVEVVPTVSDSGASVGVEFTVTGLDELFPPRGDDTERYRSISFSFGVPHVGECTTLPTNDSPRCVPSGFTGWVMGATEVPSGVTFNPAEPAEVTVPVVVDAEA